MTRKQIRESVLQAGAKNLKEFGYPQATADNILTTTIYRIFFQRMLEDEENNRTTNPDIIAVRKQLLKEIEQAEKDCQ